MGKHRTNWNPARAVFTMVADVPNELAAAWLQHVRDFDKRHPDCRFRLTGEIDAPTETIITMLEGVRPSFSEIITVVKGGDIEREKEESNSECKPQTKDG